MNEIEIIEEMMKCGKTMLVTRWNEMYRKNDAGKLIMK